MEFYVVCGTALLANLLASYSVWQQAKMLEKREREIERLLESLKPREGPRVSDEEIKDFLDKPDDDDAIPDATLFRRQVTSLASREMPREQSLEQAGEELKKAIDSDYSADALRKAFDATLKKSFDELEEMLKASHEPQEESEMQAVD